MSEPSITDEEIDGLSEQLNNLELSYAQRALLDGILKIAWDATAGEGALESGFDGSFEPGQAALIMSYDSAPTMAVNMISRSLGGSTSISTHMIGRMIGRHAVDP